jgi:hypothetical protein
MEVEYKQYLKNKTKFAKETLVLEFKKLPSRRKRDENEEKILTYLDSLRWEKALKEGKIVYQGNRTYEVKI